MFCPKMRKKCFIEYDIIRPECSTSWSTHILGHHSSPSSQILFPKSFYGANFILAELHQKSSILFFIVNVCNFNCYNTFDLLSLFFFIFLTLFLRFIFFLFSLNLLSLLLWAISSLLSRLSHSPLFSLSLLSFSHFLYQSVSQFI